MSNGCNSRREANMKSFTFARNGHATFREGEDPKNPKGHFYGASYTRKRRNMPTATKRIDGSAVYGHEQKTDRRGDTASARQRRRSATGGRFGPKRGGTPPAVCMLIDAGAREGAASSATVVGRPSSSPRPSQVKVPRGRLKGNGGGEGKE
uniref:Uncharacterized protein n=1 Tax=Steinernema glaseri TaxID=37863 RepID=A0A1I7Z541_9BILA